MSAAALPAGIRPQAYAARSFEAFSLGRQTRLLDPLSASTLAEAMVETVRRWTWDRGDRLAVRELDDGVDRLHVYAVRKKSVGQRVWDGHVSSIQHERWLDHVCTIDLNAIAGIAVGAIGSEIQLHDWAQGKRPEGARFERMA